MTFSMTEFCFSMPFASVSIQNGREGEYELCVINMTKYDLRANNI